MQALTAAPRSAFTATQVVAAYQADSLKVGVGLELLDGNDQLLTDISSDLRVTGSQVTRDAYATIHGGCKLALARQLRWGTDRVRPYMTLSGSTTGPVRWNLGVFVLTSPDTPLGETPITYAATGYDKLYFLTQVIGDSQSFAAGTNVLGNVSAMIAASGAGGAVLLDGTANAKTLASDMVWVLDDTRQPTYLQVINDLLATVAYRGMWCDENGAFRSEPYVAPALRAIEWAHTVADRRTTLVSATRTATTDTFAVPNWWRFIQRGLASAPSEGSGQYTVSDTTRPVTGQAARGYAVRKVVFLDAADQNSLVAQGNQVVAADTQVTTVVKVTTAPMPGIGHFDVYSFADPALGATPRVQATSWTLPLDGSDVTQTWQVVA